MIGNLREAYFRETGARATGQITMYAKWLEKRIESACMIEHAERDAAADKFIADTTVSNADHWSFKHGARWAAERLAEIMLSEKAEGGNQ